MNSEGTHTRPSEPLSRVRSLEFIDVHPSLPHWKDILGRWICINRDLYDITSGTLAPYSYRERPNVSVLAALREWSGLPLENWLAHVRAVYRAHKEELDASPNEEARWRRLCDLSPRDT